MPYDPSSLRPGDIILCVGRSSWTLGGLLDALIHWATVSPFDHAALVGSGCLLEALWQVTKSPLDKYASNGWVYSISGATDERCHQAISFVEERLGDRYGIAELLEDAARDIAHVPLWPRVQPRRFTCSGLVAAAWASAGVVLTYAPWPSPMDLAESPILVGQRPWEAAGDA